MKRILKYITIIFGVLILILAYFIWINLSNSHNNEELLAGLPDKITPKYGDNESVNWWKETSVYQIYPRSYMDSDGDGIGDLNGIISKLDYIESLGFETLWLSPFFSSPQKDHGYDISNYQNIQPEYGDLATVDSLITEVHKRDMKIVFDLVLNHTSDLHPWFLESKSSRNNPKSDWYVWQDGKGDDPPNNWKNILGQVSGWNYLPERDQYYYAAFLPFQPDLNMSNPEVKEAIFDMVKFWLDNGVDGFRLDIFNFIFEDQNFPDNPRTLRYLPNMNEAKWLFEEHKYNFHQPEVIDFAKDLRGVLESYPGDRFMIGEVFGSHRHMRELLGLEEYDGLNLVFLFDFLDHFDFSADYFRQKVEEYEAFYPYPLVPTYVFSNHDQARSINRLDNDMQKADILATFQLTMRGVPFIYQGEEIGMKNGDIPLTEAEDPLAAYWLTLPKWISENTGIIMNRDNCRTPMQWSAEKSAGFSSNNDTWLPLQKDYKTINVQDQLQNNNSLLHTYKELLAIRKRNPVLKNGTLQFIDRKNLPEDVLAYKRSGNGKEITVYLNFSDKVKNIDYKDIVGSIVLFSKRSQLDFSNIKLDPYGLLIIIN